MSPDTRTHASLAAGHVPYGTGTASVPGSAWSGGIDSVDSPALLASLRQLMHLRNIAIVGQAAALAVALGLGVVAPGRSDGGDPGGLLVLLNVVVSARLKRGTPATHREVAVHLAVDLAAFSALLFLAGGTANPFALLYLLHVVLIAMLLPWRLALGGTLLVVASFALGIRPRRAAAAGRRPAAVRFHDGAGSLGELHADGGGHRVVHRPHRRNAARSTSACCTRRRAAR